LSKRGVVQVGEVEKRKKDDFAGRGTGTSSQAQRRGWGEGGRGAGQKRSGGTGHWTGGKHVN